MRISPSNIILHICAAAAFLTCWGGLPSAAEAQSLVERYRAARFKTQAERVLEGYRAPPIPTRMLEIQTDSLRDWFERVFPPELPTVEPPEPALIVSRWEVVPKLGRDWFTKKFAGTRWAFEGSNSLHRLDTTFTRDLRARLQAEFGSPTQTIADHGGSPDSDDAEYIQFEYWFVLNDTLPLRVMDVNGPFERGLVVAGPHQNREVIGDIKDEILRRLADSGERAPYVDYYHLPEQRMWFLTGYDGEKYFIERIRRPDLKLGRPLPPSERN